MPTTEASRGRDDLPKTKPLLSVNDLFEEVSLEDDESDDMPKLQAMSDSEDSDEELEEDPLRNWPYGDDQDDARIADQVNTVLMRCQPYPGDTG